MNSTIFAPVALAAFALVACSAPTEESSSAATAEIRSGVVPGTFRLFSDAHHVTNPAACEGVTNLTLADGKATLTDDLIGKCPLAGQPDPNPRGYTLRVSSNSCGGKVYEGARRVSGGPSTDLVATITITDNRTATCDLVIPAAIVVDETNPGFPGSITRTLYSDDTPPPPVERIELACNEPVDHGAQVHFFVAVPSGKITHAQYTETTFVTTTLVSDMNSCSVVHEADPQIADDESLTRCSGANGFSVDLVVGGIIGTPRISIFKAAGHGGGKELVKSLRCQFVP